MQLFATLVSSVSVFMNKLRKLLGRTSEETRDDNGSGKKLDREQGFFWDLGRNWEARMDLEKDPGSQLRFYCVFMRTE